MVILAAARWGLKEPSPSVILLDFILRELWRDVRSKVPSTLFLRMLFEELTAFAYGMMIIGFFLRCEIDESGDADHSVLVRSP